MPYIGKSPSAGVRQRYQYTATAGQTTFSGADTGNLTLNYTDNNFVDVFQNGVLLKGGTTDYTATSGTSVVLTTGASVSDVIEIIVYDVFSVGNFYSRTDSDSRYYKHSLGEELILDADGDTSITADTDDQIDIRIGGSDKVTINSSGRVGIGTTDIDAPLDIVDGTEYISIAQATTDDTTKTGGLAVRHRDNEEEDFNVINGVSGSSSNIVNVGGSDFIGSLNAATSIAFFTAANRTTVDGTQRMVIASDGSLFYAKSAFDETTAGVAFDSSGLVAITRDNGTVFVINRHSTDGTLVDLRNANSTEGTIGISGSTVSYNGFSGLHESSGIATDVAIGTVVSTIDELDVYPSKQKNHKDNSEEDHPKAGQTRADHAKIKISDSVGDKRVYGVLQSYDDNGKPLVASVGIGSIRVTGACEGGDLLESNGDGTAKVQSDDIIRSKTIGKVTIGNSSTDVKLVSCVLYCG